VKREIETVWTRAYCASAFDRVLQWFTGITGASFGASYGESMGLEGVEKQVESASY
jgi:hypothetical protein